MANEMRVLITGLGGFAGRYLAEHLLSLGHDVHGTIRRAEGRANLDEWIRRQPGFRPQALHVVDITEADAVGDLVQTVQPDGLFHLAGLSFPPDSEADPAAAFRVNVLGTVNLFSAIRRHRRSCRVLSVGSADSYGLVSASDLPVTESTPFRPLSPYGASKAAMDLVAHQWAHGVGLDIVRVRPFNHTGAGQRPDFVCPDFARQVVAIENGRRSALLEVGNLDVVRDFSDVRDVVAGYVAAFETGETGEAYNVCSGVGRSVRDVLQTFLQLANVEAEVRTAAERVRRVDVPEMIGSADKLRQATGWRPRHDWSETARSILADWRRHEGV